jgi:hypothetical protein
MAVGLENVPICVRGENFPGRALRPNNNTQVGTNTATAWTGTVGDGLLHTERTQLRDNVADVLGVIACAN